MSMGSMPCALMVAMCSGTSRRARMPAMSLGCMVLTRPSSISGKPVTSSTSVTGMPDSLSSLAVPPVEMSCTPMSERPLANDSRPLLLKTEMRARWTFTYTLLRTDDPPGGGPTGGPQPACADSLAAGLQDCRQPVNSRALRLREEVRGRDDEAEHHDHGAQHVGPDSTGEAAAERRPAGRPRPSPQRPPTPPLPSRRTGWRRRRWRAATPPA